MTRILILLAATYFIHPNYLGAANIFNFAGSVFSDSINPLDGTGEIRWAGITTNSGSAIDMVAVVSPGSTYTPGDGPLNRNGPVPPGGPNEGQDVPAGLTRIKVQRATGVRFTFTFVDQVTGNPVVLPCATFSLWDFDQSASGVVTESAQFIESTGTSGTFTYAAATNIAIDATNPEQPIFSSTVTGNETDNPTDVSAPTSAQQEKVVLFEFYNTTGFEMELNVGANGGTDSRTFFFGGDVPFTVPTTTISIPEVSPVLLGLSSTLLFLGSSRSRRRREN
ncbi:MAG: hypothetical protein AAGJ79_12070 [Verrucomicrobiota bacterium]